MDQPEFSFSPLVRNFERGRVIEAHLHPFPQLLYAASGVMGVATDRGNWVIPPYRAMWLPAFCVHEVRMLTDANISSLMMQASAGLDALDCSVLEVSPLLRALLLNVLAFDASAERTERQQLTLQLLRAEIVEARVCLSPIPMPREPKLYELCQKVMADLAVDYPLTQLAVEYGGAVRTVARLFDRELGMSYRQWLDLVRMSYAQAQLDQGIPAKVVASDLGYTPSAFSAMMTRFSRRKLPSPTASPSGEVVLADLPPLNWFTRMMPSEMVSGDGRWT